MLLEDEQNDLLAKFVEAHRKVPPNSRGRFFVSSARGRQDEFHHTKVRGLEFEGRKADAEVLVQEGFLNCSLGSKGNLVFNVLPRGITHYQEIRLFRLLGGFFDTQ